MQIFKPKKTHHKEPSILHFTDLHAISTELLLDLGYLYVQKDNYNQIKPFQAHFLDQLAQEKY